MRIVKRVRLNLKDFKNEEKSVDLVQVSSNEKDFLLIVGMASYQSHVPYQTLKLSMRIALLGVNARNVISCPHIWGLKQS